MDIVILKEFVCLAKYLNFGEAAYFLHISQPTLSRHIAQLEYEMKTPLFNRSSASRQVTMTTAGEILLPEAQTIIAAYESAAEKIDAHLFGFAKNLKIGHRKLYNIKDWIKIISSFKQQYPDINLDFISGKDPAALYSDLYHDTIDVAITIAFKEFERKEYKKALFAKSSLLAVMNADHPLDSRERISCEDLIDQKLILPAEENALCFSKRLMEMFAEKNPGFRVYKYVKSIEDAEIFVGIYNGIHIVPKCYYAKSNADVCAREIHGTENTVEIYCYYKQDSSHISSIRQFIRHCQKNCCVESDV